MVNTGKCFIHIKQNTEDYVILRNKIIETQFVMIFTKIFTIIPKSFLELLNKLDKSFTRQVSSHEVNSEEFYQLFFKPQ